jgi:hypothetical protein
LIPLSLGAGKYEIFYQYGTGIERKTARNDQEILIDSHVLFGFC